jgi:hypothetical protein
VNNGVRNAAVTRTRTAARSDTIWLAPPAPSVAAVREALPETAKPWNNPAVAFAAPMATISWSASTS